MKKPLNYRLQR